MTYHVIQTEHNSKFSINIVQFNPKSVALQFSLSEIRDPQRDQQPFRINHLNDPHISWVNDTNIPAILIMLQSYTFTTSLI